MTECMAASYIGCRLSLQKINGLAAGPADWAARETRGLKIEDKIFVGKNLLSPKAAELEGAKGDEAREKQGGNGGLWDGSVDPG